MEKNPMFKEALKFVLKWEGGYSNHPDDPGGATNMGITQSVYDSWRASKKLPKRDVRHITREEVEAIYYERYWLPAGCDKLAPPLDLVVFDSAVNCGVSRAKKWLSEATKKHPKDAKGAARVVCQLRENHYRSISEKNPKLKVFLRGWLNRLNDLRKVAGI